MHTNDSLLPSSSSPRRTAAASLAALAALAVLTVSLAPPALAVTPDELVAGYEQAARKAAPSFGGFSAERGRLFFESTHGTDWSCATCHTANPAAAGKHAKTGKSIAPLAPAAAADRFTDPAKVEKWFKRNCNDVLGRECTTTEKGDVLTYLLSVQR